MTRVLVTGGLGFIGSFTVDKLVERGYEARSLDNLERQVHHGKSPSFRNSRAEYFDGDVRSRASWMKALEDVDYVIHLAATVGVGQSFWQARKYVDTNIGGTATLLESLLKERRLGNRVKKLVVASSKSIYGEGSYECRGHGLIQPQARGIEQLKKRDWEAHCTRCGNVLKPVGIKEDKPLQNTSPYALSKYATETLAMDYASVLGLPTIAFRYFNVYGPRQSLSNPYTGVVAIFLSRLKNNRAPVVFEDGNQLRDYIYAEDVARLNVDALENKAQGVYNVGTGEPHSLLEVIDNLQAVLGKDIPPTVTQEYRPGDNRHDYADNSKLKASFEVGRFMPLKVGLRRLVKWASNERALDLFEKEEKERTSFFRFQHN
jgi:dTDP-L-rhamnose 4-epimerase